jgi:hypothetical protein
MEEGKDSAFNLRAGVSLDGRWRERSPDYALTNVGGNEERNTRAETIALLKKLVPKEHKNTSEYQLNDKKET